MTLPAPSGVCLFCGQPCTTVAHTPAGDVSACMSDGRPSCKPAAKPCPECGGRCETGHGRDTDGCHECGGTGRDVALGCTCGRCPPGREQYCTDETHDEDRTAPEPRSDEERDYEESR